MTSPRERFPVGGGVYAYARKDEGGYTIPLSEWLRLKKLIGRMEKNVPWFLSIACVLAGGAISIGVTLWSLSTNEPETRNVLWTAFVGFIFATLIAAVYAVLEYCRNDSRRNDVLEEMADIEKKYATPEIGE